MHANIKRPRHLICALWVGLALMGFMAPEESAEPLPPLCVEITPDHPLFLFRAAISAQAAVAEARPTPAQEAQAAWVLLPDLLKPYAVMEIDAGGQDVDTKGIAYRGILAELQETDVPVVIEVGNENARSILPLKVVEDLIREFPCVKGVSVQPGAFNEYDLPRVGNELDMPAPARWLIGLLDLAPRYGRFVVIRLDGLGWPRAMANAWCRPLYEKMREQRQYVVPIAGYRGPHCVTAITSLMGLWLEDAVGQWGVAATSDWYVDARFARPGVFGPPPGPEAMPPQMYRAMLLNGAMTGATVYAFDRGADLWFGPQRAMWDQAICPTLTQMLGHGLVVRREFVSKKARVAYQLVASRTSQEFHLNLRDLDGTIDQGLFIRGAYGLEKPGQIPELILNSGRHYWIPVVSPYASEEVLQSFERVVRPGTVSSVEGWVDQLDRHYRPDGIGTAFICCIGRGMFVMNTRENVHEEQTFRLLAAPAPVRDVEARRTGQGIELTWPRREGDVAWRVYRRAFPEGLFECVAGDVDDHRWVDSSIGQDQGVAYAVTALTDEEEPYEGTVGFGDYLALSVVESRIVVEVVVGPLLDYAKARPVDEQTNIGDPCPSAWWPNMEGLSEAERPIAEEISKRIEMWDRAVADENLDAVLDLYSTDYVDPQGWRFQYVRRAFQWFFERYDACHMCRQIRQWQFDPGETPRRVRVLLYCRFTGNAVTDVTGRFADLPMYFPRSETGEIWLTFSNLDGTWRLIRTDPALPNFGDILSFSSGYSNSYPPGPDVYVSPTPAAPAF